MNGVRVGTLGDIPFFVSPWYLVLALYGGAMVGDVALGGLWVLCLTISLCVHELGHALVARHLRLNPRILLHGFGGLCAHDRAELDRHDVAIVASGPAAGLVLGLVFLGLLHLLPKGMPGAMAHPMVDAGLRWMVWLNIFWSLVNLVPIWPLDGGQLFRLGMLRFTSPARAEQATHTLGIALAIAAVGVAAVVGFGRFAMLIAALIAWENFRALRGERSSGPVRSQSRFSRGLFEEARTAFEAGDYETCARLCHQIRSEPRVPDGVLIEVWRLLGLSTARSGRCREAVSYLKRAKLDDEVAEAWLGCLLEQERDDAIAELVGSREWQRLGSRGQAIVERLHAGG